jgi:hypothetical protein
MKIKEPSTISNIIYNGLVISIFLLGLWLAIWARRQVQGQIETGKAESRNSEPPAKARSVRVLMFGEELCVFTNVVAVVPCTANCTLIRYVADGRTNDFHAWAAEVQEQIGNGESRKLKP